MLEEAGMVKKAANESAIIAGMLVVDKATEASRLIPGVGVGAVCAYAFVHGIDELSDQSDDEDAVVIEC